LGVSFDVRPPRGGGRIGSSRRTRRGPPDRCTVEREQHLLALLGNSPVTPTRFADAFLEPPLYNNGYASGMGTLYTAA
jgi:hypothetical protein